MSRPGSSDRAAAFTLLELVVAIVVIGLLVAVALPRFVGVADDARVANVKAMSGAFKAGADLVHARWIAKGSSASVNAVEAEGGATIGVNDAGWPENLLSAGGDGVVTASECASLWTGLLTSAQGISTTASAAAWLASAPSNTTCRFDSNATTGRYFTYDASNGALAVVAASGSASSSGSTSGATPASTTGSSTTTSSGSGSTTCGLLGIEPFAALLLVRALRRSNRRSTRR